MMMMATVDHRRLVAAAAAGGAGDDADDAIVHLLVFSPSSCLSLMLGRRSRDELLPVLSIEA